jgi:hypothetical protein
VPPINFGMKLNLNKLLAIIDLKKNQHLQVIADFLSFHFSRAEALKESLFCFVEDPWLPNTRAW